MSEPVAASVPPKLTTVPRAGTAAEDFASTLAETTDSSGDRSGTSSSYDAVPRVFLDCSDKEYIRQLCIVRKIKDLLVSEAVNLDPQDRFLVRLGVLNSLRYTRNGHAPPTEAWDELDARLQGLTRYLKDDTGELKRKLQVRLAPRFLYWLPLAMGLLAAFCLCLAVAPPAYSLFPNVFGTLSSTAPPPELVQQIWRFAAFMAWLIALGSLGSVAFLYVNVLSIETDKSVDVTSASFLSMRIILGALFGLVIGLPIGHPYFVSFCLQIHNVASAAGGAGAAVAATKIEWSSGLALLLPFLLGFSTPLVLNVLNRCVDGVQTVFGIEDKK